MFKFKKGDFVQVYVPCVAKIKRINKKIGYTLTILPCDKYEVAYYQDNDLVKISKKSEYYGERIKEAVSKKGK